MSDQQTPSLYLGPCRLLDWKQGARQGMTVDLVVQLPGADGAHPFRIVRTGKEAGQRVALLVTFPPFDDGLYGHVIYEGEAVVLRWSENDRTGMMVRFELDDGPDGVTGRHPFFGLTIGVRTGEPLILNAIAIAENEKQVPPSAVRRKVPFDQMPPTAQASILGRDPRFRAFLSNCLDSLVPEAQMRSSLRELEAGNPDNFPTAAVRAILGVVSRSVMNSETAEGSRARERWKNLRSLYTDHLWGRPVHAASMSEIRQ